MFDDIKEVTVDDLRGAKRVDIFVNVGGTLFQIDESKKAKSPIHGALRVSKKLSAGLYQLTADAETRLRCSGKFFLKSRDVVMVLPRIDHRTFVGSTDKPESITEEMLDKALEVAKLKGEGLFVYALLPGDLVGSYDLMLFRKTRSTVIEADLSSPTSDQ